MKRTTARRIGNTLDSVPLRIFLALTGFAMLASLGGCMTPPAQMNDPYYAPVLPKSTAAPEPSNGSIYQAGHGMFLFEDRKAGRIGDVLTVVLMEEAEGESESETSLNKSTSIDVDNPTILGQMVDAGGLPGVVGSLLNKLPLDGGEINSLDTDLDSNHTFSGDGDTDQTHALTGTITVTVHDVMPNGLLYVRGEKWLTINQSKEYIRVAGLVRPEDIGAGNTVISTKMADARIEFSGTGPVANANAVGWLARFFLSPMWFF